MFCTLASLFTLTNSRGGEVFVVGVVVPKSTPNAATQTNSGRVGAQVLGWFSFYLKGSETIFNPDWSMWLALLGGIQSTKSLNWVWGQLDGLGLKYNMCLSGKATLSKKNRWPYSFEWFSDFFFTLRCFFIVKNVRKKKSWPLHKRFLPSGDLNHMYYFVGLISRVWKIVIGGLS